MSNVKPDTIIRTVVLVLALVNQILAMKGISPLPLADEEVTEILSMVFTTAASLWAWWKNNSFTTAAIQADTYMTALKAKEKSDV